MNTMKRQAVLNEISDHLNILWAVVKSRNRRNMTDASIALEGIMAKFLNALFDWDLEDLNASRQNNPAADLGDVDRRIAIQVTALCDRRKINDAVKSATKYKLRDKFKTFIVLILAPQKPKQSGVRGRRDSSLDIQVWDIVDVVTRANGKEISDSSVKRAAKLIRSELNLPRRHSSASGGASGGPTLRARFQQDDGELIKLGRSKCPPYAMDVWIDGAPPDTKKVKFEVLDTGFHGNPWKVKRGTGPRDFLTDDFNSWGDVAILARGRNGRRVKWTLETTLYQALAEQHAKDMQSSAVKKALAQIRDN